ncbi:unnamed protein product, partial [Effrenium voratum]
MVMMRSRTKSRGMCICLLGIALALLVQPSTDFTQGAPGLKDHDVATRHQLHAGVARRAGAAQEDNSAEAGDTCIRLERWACWLSGPARSRGGGGPSEKATSQLGLAQVVAEADRVLEDNGALKETKAVLRKAQKIYPGKWTLSGLKDELQQKLREFVEEAKAASKGLKEDLLLQQLKLAIAQQEAAQEQEVKAVAGLEKAEDSGTKEEVEKAEEQVEKVEKAAKKVEKAERKVERATKEVKEAKASGRTKESEAVQNVREAKEHVEKLVEKFAGPEYWARPTPRFRKYVRGERLTWPGTDLPCPGEFPNASQIGDGRTTAFGISNAFGTGKTEVAIRSAEMTCAAEPGLRVAYISFSNGYWALTDSVLDDSIREKQGSQVVFRCSKYCGLWLMAGIWATRVIDNEVQGNSELFQAIVGAYMGNPQWKLPDYGEQTDAKLIVILDEVQRFSFSALEGLVTIIIVPSKTRMSLVVGAFSPSFLFLSGNRLRDIELPVLAEDDMEQIFQ